MKTLRDISWQVTEPEYRADPALSYSTLAKFAREGFNNLDSLFDRVETPSLTFGSAVDCLITSGQEEFDRHFMVAEFPALKDSVRSIINVLFENYSQNYRSLNEIPDSVIINQTVIDAYQLNWKPETRAKVIKEQGSEYYSLLYLAGDRTVIDTTLKEQIDNAVTALKSSPTTSVYFADNGFDSLFREYQLKFKATLDGVDYRCMADLLITNHDAKIVYPIDLKTSSHAEWDFYESFIQWRYDIQARLYWRIIRANMDKDPLFKDYKLADYTFIVVNKKTLTPLTWIFEDTQKTGTLVYGKNKQIELQDPFELGKQLSIYLSSRPPVPNGINIGSPDTTENTNSITEWLNKK
jgi:hypothetical protein